MTGIGYGDIYPISNAERVCVIFNMVVGAGVFAYIISTIGTMVRRYNLLATQYKEKMNYVN